MQTLNLCLIDSVLFAFTYTKITLIFSVTVPVIIAPSFANAHVFAIKIIQYNHAKVFTSKEMFCAFLLQSAYNNFHEIGRNLG